MKLLSLLYADWIREDELAAHQNSDRIWLPSHMFQRWLLEEEAGAVVIAELGGLGVCVYGPHRGEENTLYAPDWICAALRVSGMPEEECDDYLIPMRVKPQQCTFVKLQPFTSAHIRLAEAMMTPAEDILARGFENYTSLHKGQTLTLQLGDETLDVEVLATIPDTNDILCIRAGEIELELLPPLDLADETVAECTFVPAPVVTPQPVPVQPEPVAEPTPILSKEQRRELMAAAALARLAKNNETA